MEENHILLKSIIKIENEQFQEHSSDDILRIKAGMYVFFKNIRR